MKRLTLSVLLALIVANPVSARERFIAVDQEQIIIGDWITATYSGSDYARFSCSQESIVVWEELTYLPGEGGPRQVTPILPYHPLTYSQCEVRLVIQRGHKERTLATDTFVVYSPV